MKLSVITLCGCLAFGDVALAQYSLQAPEPAPGSRIRGIAALGSIPMDKRFEDFAPEEKARLRAAYDGMPEGDEPPFPREGLKKILLALQQMSERREATGRLRIHFLIDSNGRAVRADIYESPDDLLTNAIARVVLGEPFKPAVCSGKPCAMEFPLIADLSLTVR